MFKPKYLVVVVSCALALGVGTSLDAGDGIWTTTFPYGGHVPGHGMAIDASSGRLDISPNNRGIYYSDDGAASWQNLTDDMYALPFCHGCVAAVARNNGNGWLYVLAWNGPGRTLFGSGDNGASWVALDDGATDAMVVAFDPSDADTIYLGFTDGRLRRTTDHGASWSWVGAGLPSGEIMALEVDPSDSDIVWAGCRGNGLYKSTDAGASFSLSLAADDVVDIAVDPSNSDVVYAADNDGATGKCLHKTDDGGVTWGQLLASTLEFGGWYQTLLAFDPTDSDILYVSSWQEVYRTDDAGGSWTSATVVTGVQVSAVVVDPATTTTIYAGTTGEGVYKSIDSGATWSDASSGIRARSVPSGQPHTVHVAATGEIYSGNQVGGWRSVDGGLNWTRLNENTYEIGSITTNPSTAGEVWASRWNLWFSSDYGVNWGDGSGGNFCCYQSTDVAVHPTDPDTVYFSGNIPSGGDPEGIQKSTDGGSTWSVINNGLPSPASVQTIAVDPNNGDVLYAGIPDWWGGPNGVFKSTDGGANWFQLGGLPDPIAPTQIVVHPTDSNLVFLGTQGNDAGVFRSYDGGASWSKVLDDHVEGLAVDPSDPNRIYVATWWDPQFYCTLDGGVTWAVINNGLPHSPGMVSLAVDPTSTNRRIFATTTSGVWEYTFAGTVTLSVSNANDSGSGSLRDALLQAQQDGLPNEIRFEPWMAGQTIAPSSELPHLNTGEPVDLDGDINGDCVPDIAIGGWAMAGIGGNGINVYSDGNRVSGLAIHSFSNGDGIVVGGSNNTVECNYLGTGFAGNEQWGIASNALKLVSGAVDNLVTNNLITFNGRGIDLTDGASDNQIGPDNHIANNNDAGIAVSDGLDDRYPDFTGPAADSKQVFPVISFSDDNGGGPWHSADAITVTDAGGGTFHDNFGARFTGAVEVDTAGWYTFEVQHNEAARLVVDGGTLFNDGCCGPSSGTVFLTDSTAYTIELDFLEQGGPAQLDLSVTGPGSAALSTDTCPGGLQPGLCGEHFRLRIPSEGNTITQNSIHDNGGLGIDLAGYSGPMGSVNPNDAGDVDVGANTLLNYAVITGSTDLTGNNFLIYGTAPAGTTVEVFARQADPSGFGEGARFLGDDIADGSDNFSVTIHLDPDEYSVTTTATDGAGNTSEFSGSWQLLVHSITVTSTADSGPGTLRDALNQANSDGVETEISIDPTLSGQTIYPLSQLPGLDEGGTTINADLGGDCVPDLEIDGSLVGGGGGLMVNSSGNTLRGLVVNRFPNQGIAISSGANGNVVQCCYVGTEPNGVTAAANGQSGIEVRGSDNLIGPGNVAAHNGFHGIAVLESAVQGYPDFPGLTPDYSGVFEFMSFHESCGAFESIDGIIPLDGSGSPFTESFDARFTGTLSVDADGDYNLALANLDDRGRIVIDGAVLMDVNSCCDPLDAWTYLTAGDHSIEVDFSEGCGASGFDLEITGPGNAWLTTGGQPGLYGELFQLRIPAERNTITQNSTFDNGYLGIGFNCCCDPLGNDIGDIDSGPNTVLNYPELGGFTDYGGGSYDVYGAAGPDATVEVFAVAADPSGYGEGRVFLGANIADGAGNFLVPVSLPAAYDTVTATATDPAGNTSEFSQNLAVKQPDEATVGSAEGFQGDTIEVPLYVRDLSTTRLGLDQPAGSLIQGFTLQVQFDPGVVQSVSAYHSGITSGLTPLFATFTTTGDTITYLASFNESTNLIPFTLDGPGPGDEVARVVITIQPAARPGWSGLSLLTGTMLVNQAGTMTEREGQQLTLMGGGFNVRTRAATSLYAQALSSSSVRLRWNDPMADETGFRVERSPDGGSWSPVHTAGPDDTSYDDGGLDPATLYYYRVIAFNGGVDAPASNTAWVETAPASAAKTCSTRIGNDTSWQRFAFPAFNGTNWAMTSQERWNQSDDIRFQFLDGWGMPTGASIAVTDTDMQSQYPVMRFNGTRFGLMWGEHMRGPEGQITSNQFFALLDANGQTVRKGVRLFETVPLGYLNNNLIYAFDSDGGGWGHALPGYFNPPSTNIGFCRFSQDGELVTGPVQISSTSGVEWNVNLAWGGAEYGVVWKHEDGSTQEIIFQRVLPDGSLPAGPVTVWQNGPDQGCDTASIVWNGSGWAIAFVVMEPDGAWAIYLRLLAADGSPLGPASRLSLDEDPEYPGWGVQVYDDVPFLLNRPGGGYLCYISTYDINTDVYEIARYEADSAGNRVGTRDFLSNRDGAHSIMQRAASNGVNDLLVYNDCQTGGLEIGGVVVDPDGGIVSGPFDMSWGHGPGNTWYFGEAGGFVTVPMLDGFLTLWQDQTGGYSQLYGQYFDGAGNPSASWYPMSGREIRGLAAAEALGDTFAVAFKDAGNTVVFDRLNVFGGSFLGEVEIAHDTGGRGGAGVAFSGEMFGVAYFDGNQIVLQRLDLDGNPIGPPVIVGSGGRHSLQLQWTGAGWAVTWFGFDSFVYYALVDSYGFVIVGPTPLTANPIDWSGYHAHWNGEYFGLAWWEDRGFDPAGPEVYFTTFDLNGAPMIPEAMVVNPYSSGGALRLYWDNDRFHLLRHGSSGPDLADGVSEDEILPDGTVFGSVRRHTNRGTPGGVAFNGTTVGLSWGQLRQAYFQTSECLADPGPAPCPDLAISFDDVAVRLDWNLVDDPESGIQRYNLYRDGFMLAELNPGTQHYDDYGFRAGFVHTYEVRAMNGAYQESQGCPVHTFSTMSGDVNGDGAVDVADIFYLINFLFSGGPQLLGDGDTNGDGVVDAADIFYLINYVFDGGLPPMDVATDGPADGGPADELGLGSTTATPAETVVIPVRIADRSGTALDEDAGPNGGIQGFAFQVSFPASEVESISFAQAGVTAGKTAVMPFVEASDDALVVLLNFNETVFPLAFTLDAPEGNLVGELQLKLRDTAAPGTVVPLALDPISALVNHDATTTESPARGNLALLNGSITIEIAKPAIFGDNFETADTSRWSKSHGN